MKRQSPATFFGFCLLILTALLAASCASGSDSTDTDNSDTPFEASETPRTARPVPFADQNSNSENTDGFPVFAEPKTPDHKATAIATDYSHSCALREGGTISCWGHNEDGQLGDGTEESSLVPVQVANIADATAIATGGGLNHSHSCALREGGTISCWGNNYYGQLGNGQSGRDADSSVPVQVVGIADATAIAAGGGYYGGHSCALREGGTISCWGANGSGQLGDGTGDDSSVPVQVVNIADATAIATGSSHSSCALREGGTISCWGNNNRGQLGNGQSGRDADSSVPVQVVGIADATAIAAGGGYYGGHSCALRQGGTISCWGYNEYGQLGDGTEESSLVPVQVANIADATAIATGSGWGGYVSGGHSCALREGGTISCWGANGSGRLGDGTRDGSLVPVQVVGIADATAIATGAGYSCALRQGGTISCWGYNSYGVLGDGTGYGSLVPVGVVGIADATAIATGRWHSCALREGGTISCWGSGQLGDGTEDYYSLVPVQVANIADATAIATASSHSCALREGGTISCWGNNYYGQLGDGTEESSLVPVQVVGIADATAIAAGGGFYGGHSCALRQGGTISCWGANGYGQLGDGTGDDSSVPVQVVGIADATAIARGGGEYGGHSCALREGGTISCWGDNGSGELGDGTEDYYSLVPVQVVGIADATAIARGGGEYGRYSCALREGGTISCWGYNYYGQLGDGTEESSLVPVGVVGIADATAIATGWGHSCALREGGTISCWGGNYSGELGDGTGDVSLVPVGVVGIADATAIATGDFHSCALREGGTISCWGRNEDGQLGDGTWLLPRFVVGFGG